MQTSLDASIYKIGTSVRKENLQYSLLVKPAKNKFLKIEGVGKMDERWNLTALCFLDADYF